VSSQLDDPYLFWILGLWEICLLQDTYMKTFEYTKSIGLQGLTIVLLTWIQQLLILVLRSDGSDLFFIVVHSSSCLGLNQKAQIESCIQSSGCCSSLSSATPLPFKEGIFLRFQWINLLNLLLWDLLLGIFPCCLS
jgi:hypothetical protein